MFYFILFSGAGCNDYTGAVVRQYDFDYTSDAVTGSALSNAENALSHTGMSIHF